MYWLILLTFILLPLGFAAFLVWRAYQLAISGKVNLTRQWLPRPVPGIEQYAKLFALRDLLLAFGCLLFVGLLLAFPAYFSAWPSLLAAFGFLHQGITYYAVHKVQRQNRKMLRDA
jgi:hypothetical protein